MMLESGGIEHLTPYGPELALLVTLMLSLTLPDAVVDAVF
jgi:hypothetical protein